MRIIRSALLCLGAILTLSSCYQLTEEVTISSSGKGSYATTIDMGQMLSMLKSFAGSNDSLKEVMSKRIDSTISFSNFTDTATNVDAETKALLKNATMRVRMIGDSDVFSINMNMPFDNLAQLQKIQAFQNKSGNAFQSLGKMFKGGDEDGKDHSSDGLPSQKMASALETAWTANSITRTVNKEAFDKLMQDSSIQQVKQMSAMMGDMKYTTIIHLPRPVRKVDSKQSKLSDDRKTVTLEYDLTDIFDAPETFAYKIEY